MYKKHEKLCKKSDFKDIFLKLTTNGQSDKAFLLTSEFCPQRVVCPCPGAIYMWKNIKKMCITSEFKEICLKLVTNGQNNKSFLLTSKVCPQGDFCPYPGAIYIYNIIKNVYKIRFQRDHFETCNIWGLSVVIKLKLATNGQSDKGFLLTSLFVPKGLSPPALGLYTCIKASKYIPGPGVRWAFTGALVLWF